MATSQSTHRHQAQTIEIASKRGETWTLADFDLLEACPEIPARELADTLGRTLYSIQTMRYLVSERKLRGESPTVIVRAARDRRTGRTLAYDRGFTTLPETW
jgi:hypothetical protein